MASIPKSVQPVERHVQDSGQLCRKFIREIQILFAQETLTRVQDDKSTGRSCAGIGKARKFVRQYQDARVQLPCPGSFKFPIKRQTVFAAEIAAGHHRLAWRMLCRCDHALSGRSCDQYCSVFSFDKMIKLSSCLCLT